MSTWSREMISDAAVDSRDVLRAVGATNRGSIRADLPNRSWKGETPAEVLIVFIMLKRTRGSARFQPL